MGKQKSFIFTKRLADSLVNLPSETVGGIVKHLCKYVFDGAESDKRYRKFERLAERPVKKGASAEEMERIMSYINGRLGTKYTLTDARVQQINARFAEGFGVEDFVIVIDTMLEQWGRDEKMASNLKPETLFGTKFDSYRNREALLKTTSRMQDKPENGSSFETDEFFAAALEKAARIGGVGNG